MTSNICHYVILVGLFLSGCTAKDSRVEEEKMPISSIINDLIRNEVVSLTGITELMHSPVFRDLAISITQIDKTEIAKMISEEKTPDLDKTFAIYLLAYSLNENDYWDIMLPSLRPELSDYVMERILHPIPYGPGFSFAIYENKHREALEALLKQVNNREIGVVLKFILSGEASVLSKEFVNDPLAVNFDPAILNLLGPSWNMVKKRAGLGSATANPSQ